jgi:hypothetical protein
MTKAVWSGVVAVVFLLVMLFSTNLFAQTTATATVNASAAVNAKAKLTIAGSVAFADADPDGTPTISATALDIAVKARTSPSGNVTLTVVASGDLKNATNDVISISNLTWVVTGAGFAPGTSNTTVEQSVGSWTGSGNYSGTQTYRLANSWAYATGNYSTTLTYTLTAP